MRVENNLKWILLFLVLSVINLGKEFKIISYNIYGARLANGTTLGESIKRYDPDFVSLQEVDKNTIRSNFKDVTREIASVLGYNYYYFQKSRDYDGGEYGIAFISRYPVEKIFTHELPSIGIEKRQVLAAKLTNETYGKNITVINTHLDYRPEIKTEELNDLLITSQLIEGDIKFLSGDFNFLPTSDHYKGISSDWRDTYYEGENIKEDGTKEKRTSDTPRIDYILGEKLDSWTTKKSFFINDDTQEWTKLSDHLPYMVILDIK